MAYEWVFLSLYLPVPGSSHKSVRGRYIYIKYYNAVPASKQSSQPRTECPTCQLRSQRFAADAWRTQKTRQTIPGMAQRHNLKPSPRHRLRMPRPLPPRIAFFPWLFFLFFVFLSVSGMLSQRKQQIPKWRQPNEFNSFHLISIGGGE